MPRVVSGKARGLILKAPKGDNVRPTSDKSKEAIFSSIADYIPESSFLDLFAGTGQIGIEALSRGAESAVFVDSSAESIKFIRQNLASTRLGESARVLKKPAQAAIKSLKAKGEKFDLIYFDPPYAKFEELFLELSEELLPAILAENGLLICEEDSIEYAKRGEALIPDNFVCLRHCKYGQAMVSFYVIRKA